MPSFRTTIGDFFSDKKDTLPVNRYEGFQSNGSVVLRDRRGTRRAEIPDVDTKSETMGDDPLAIYKPTGAKQVDAAKAMGNFTGWAYAAVNAIANEIANIQWRLYQVEGDDHEEQEDHPLLTLLDGMNETMTGIELKYVTASHLEFPGNCYWLLDGVTVRWPFSRWSRALLPPAQKLDCFAALENIEEEAQRLAARAFKAWICRDDSAGLVARQGEQWPMRG